MTATLLDTYTGETREVDGINEYSWTDGNWSCDCNRMMYFGREDESGNCVGCHRYLVVKADFKPDDVICSLRALNSSYPKALLKKYNLC